MTTNEWYVRMLVATAVTFALYFAHAVGFEIVGYRGFVRETELLVWLSMVSFGAALYCWYRAAGNER